MFWVLTHFPGDNDPNGVVFTQRWTTLMRPLPQVKSILRLLVMPLLPDRAFDIQWLLGTQGDSAGFTPEN